MSAKTKESILLSPTIDGRYRVVKLVNKLEPAVGTYVKEQLVRDLIASGVTVTISKVSK